MIPPIPPLTGSHLRAYEKIFQHPISHGLTWRDLRALLEHIAEVVEQPNGNLKVTHHGQVLVIHPPRAKELEDTEIIALRHFLERSAKAAPLASAEPTHALVVIDHQGARVFHSLVRDALSEAILPHDPDGYFRHAHHSRDFSRGEEKPDPNSFFEPVAGDLQGAQKILVFGTGTGTGSEMDQFVAWLGHHHRELAARIIGTIVVDQSHLTEDQLLAKAREYYSSQTPA